MRIGATATAIVFQYLYAGTTYTIAMEAGAGGWTLIAQSAAGADDVEILGAIAYLTALGGGELYIERGDYDCTASIIVDSNISIYGSKDAVLQINAAVHGIIILGQHITLSGFTVDGVATSRVLVFIYSTVAITTQDVLVDNLYLLNNNSEDAVYVGNEEYPAYDVVVRKCFASNIARHAYVVTSGVNVLFHHNFYTGVTIGGMVIETGARVPPEVIENIIFLDNVGDAASGGHIGLDAAGDQGDILYDGNMMTCDGSATGFQITEGRTEVIFINNVVDGAGVNGALYVSGDATDVLIKNNRFKNLAANTRGIWIRNVERLWFIDNEVLDATLDGIVVAPNVSANAIRIERNKIVSSTGVGINLASGTATDLEVNHNLISVPGNYGIYCNIVGTILDGNTVDGNVSQINIRVLVNECAIINNKVRNSDQVAFRADGEAIIVAWNKVVDCTNWGIGIYGDNNYVFENNLIDTSNGTKIFINTGVANTQLWKNIGLIVATHLDDRGTNTILETIVIPFVQGTTFISADGSAKGWEINAELDMAIALGQLPLEVHGVKKIKIWAVALGAPVGAGGQMHLDILFNAGGSLEAYNLAANSWTLANFDSEEADYVNTNVIHWVIEDGDVGNELRNLLGGDRVELKVNGGTAVAPDGATNATFGVIEYEYV